MNNLPVQAAGALALLTATACGYGLWVRPRRVGAGATLLLLLIVMTMAGGLIGSTGWWLDDPNAFSWDLPPLASRMLGAAGWAFGAAAWMTLRRPVAARLRLILLMLAVYLIPLAAAIVLFHLDRFDFSAPITYAFFVIVVMMAVPTVVFLWRLPMVIPEGSQESAAPAPRMRSGLALVGLAAGIWGMALFVSDSGPFAPVWAWPGDLLTSRLIAVMLLTIATACVYSRRSSSAARVTLAVMLVYGVGVVLAGLANGAAGKPVPVFYAAAFGALALGSAAVLVRRP